MTEPTVQQLLERFEQLYGDSLPNDCVILGAVLIPLQRIIRLQIANQSVFIETTRETVRGFELSCFDEALDHLEARIRSRTAYVRFSEVAP